MSSANSRQFLWILLLVTLLLTVIVASATTLEPMTFARLTRQATAIVRVRCVSVQSAWANGEIWTDSRFAVVQQEKADTYGLDQLEYARPLSSSKVPPPQLAALGSATAPVTTATITVRKPCRPIPWPTIWNR